MEDNTNLRIIQLKNNNSKQNKKQENWPQKYKIEEITEIKEYL